MSRTDRYTLVGVVIVGLAALVAFAAGSTRTFLIVALVFVVATAILTLVWDSQVSRVLRRDLGDRRQERWRRGNDAAWKITVTQGWGFDSQIRLDAPEPTGHALTVAMIRGGFINPYIGAAVSCGVRLPNAQWFWVDGVDFSAGTVLIDLPGDFPTWPSDLDRLPPGDYRITWTVRFVKPRLPVVVSRAYATNTNGALVPVESRWSLMRRRVYRVWRHLRGRDDE